MSILTVIVIGDEHSIAGMKGLTAYRLRFRKLTQKVYSRKGQNTKNVVQDAPEM